MTIPFVCGHNEVIPIMVMEDPVAYKIKEYKEYLDEKEKIASSFNDGKPWFKFTKKQIIFQVIIGIAILIIGAYGIKQRTVIKSKATNLDQTGVYFVDSSNQVITETHAAAAKLRIVFVPPENGKIYKDKSDNKFYVAQGGLLHYLPLTSLINQYGGSGNVKEVDHSVIEQWPIGEPIALPSPSPSSSPSPTPTAPPASDPNAVNYHLERNWNSFGIPVNLSTSLTPEHFLKDITQNKCDNIVGFDNTSSQAKSYFTDPNRAILNSMTAIEGGKGYTVKCPNGPVDFQLSGTPNTNNPQITNGWTKVAMPRNINKNARTLLTELSNSNLSCDIIQKIIDGGNGTMNDTEIFRISDSGNGFNLSDTKGYDIHCIIPTSTPAPTPTPQPTPQALTYNLPADFVSQQGNKGWYYYCGSSGQSANEAIFADSLNRSWIGGQGWTCNSPGSSWAHMDSSRIIPGDNEKLYVFWKAPLAGSATITASSNWTDNKGSGFKIGVGYAQSVGSVPQGDNILQSADVGGSNPSQANLTGSHQMQGNDVLVYWIDSNGVTYGDVSSYNINIQFTPPGAVQGITAYAQTTPQTAYPTHFKIGRNALELAQAQPQVFTPTANPGGIGVKYDVDVNLTTGANNYLVKFIFGTEEKPVLSTSALTYTPCTQAQSCPTTCHKDLVNVPDGQCGQTSCPGNAPAAGSCPAACHTDTQNVPDGNCSQTTCQPNAPQAQTCPTTCHKDPVNVPDGQCGTTPCPGNAPQAQSCPTTCHKDPVTVSDGNCGQTTCPGNAPAVGTCPTACGRPATTVPDGNCGTTSCPATRSCLDINANGSIDLPDISLYISRGGVDLNGDGAANGTDYNQLYQAWVNGGRQR